MRQASVYLLASHYHGTLYVGMTSNLAQRVWQHRHNVFEGFTRRYGVHTLVWYEAHENMYSAIECRSKGERLGPGLRRDDDGWVIVRGGEPGMAGP